MTDYFFDKCSQEALSEIEKLVSELDLMQITPEESTKTWIGKSDRSLIQVIGYRRDNEAPLVLQTCSDINHEDPQVLRVIKRLIEICKPTEVYTLKDKPYKLPDFLFK